MSKLSSTNFLPLPPTASLSSIAIAVKGDIDPKSISTIKIATMGPFAGIGDSLFWMTIRPICLGIGISLADGGSLLGPIVFLVLFNIFHIWTRYYPLMKGYELGTNFLATVHGGGIIQRITEAAGVIGLMVLGVMVATMVTVKTPLEIVVGQAKVGLQGVFDAILPNMLPLALTFLCFWLLKKGKSPTKILFSILILGILGVLITVF
jgi:mannose/fructose/N-acetylgalactosamine-specific phosphotransferase system component IID